jgi:hypothetical protein
MENINIELAVKQYKKHLEAVKKYQKEHPEKMSEKAKKYYQNLKVSNPDAYKKMLDIKKEKYKLRKLNKTSIEISN